MQTLKATGNVQFALEASSISPRYLATIANRTRPQEFINVIYAEKRSVLTLI